MVFKWLADVRRYDQNPYPGVVAAIARHCGLALRTPEGAQLSFSDPEATADVRENFLKGMLGLTESDAKLDAGIAEVGKQMEEDEHKNRVTAYYLLTKHFEKFGAFGYAAAGAAGAAAASVAGAVTNRFRDAGARRPAYADDGIFGTLFLAGAGMAGLLFFGMAAASWLTYLAESEEAAAPAAAAVEAAPAAAPAAPAGAGVAAAEVDGAPMLTVYFDTGSAGISPEFDAAAADMVTYLEANPDASVAISGFNDPSGNAEFNAELSKNRAENVQAALVAQGVDAGRTALVRPDNTTISNMTIAEARRVEVTIAQ